MQNTDVEWFSNTFRKIEVRRSFFATYPAKTRVSSCHDLHKETRRRRCRRNVGQVRRQSFHVSVKTRSKICYSASRVKTSNVLFHNSPLPPALTKSIACNSSLHDWPNCLDSMSTLRKIVCTRKMILWSWKTERWWCCRMCDSTATKIHSMSRSD